MEIFEQQPQQWTGIPPDRPSRPSATWLMFATILGMLIGGAIVYFTVDTSPDSASAPTDTTPAATSTTAPEVSTTTAASAAAPVAGGTAIDVAYQTTYPVEGSTTGFIALTDGSATEPIPDSDSTLVVDVADSLAADLDGDGVDDAVVVLAVNTGGTGVFYYAYGVFADPEQTVVTNAIALGDRIAIDTTSVDSFNGTATIRYRDHSDQAPFAEAPDLLVVSDLQLLRTGAQEVARGSIPVSDTADPKLTSASTITTGGLGPVRVEMTVEEATKAAGVAIIAPTESAIAASPGCGFARADGIEGVGFMLIDGVIKRVDVFSGPTSTSSGAKIGSTEQEIKDLFPGIITVGPHQYVENGHYLTLTPTADSLKDSRVVFETDGAVVTSFRSGKTPQVEWVEGCA